MPSLAFATAHAVNKKVKQVGRRTYRTLAPYIVAVLLLPVLELYYRHSIELPKVAHLHTHPPAPPTAASSDAAIGTDAADAPGPGTFNAVYNVRKVPHPDADAERTIIGNITLLQPAPRGRLIVMTYKRSKSLSRLLTSISQAEYLGDRVDVDIWIDRPSVSGGIGEVNQTVLQVARGFEWRHGAKTVYTRRRHGGLYAQWLDTWNVTDGSADDELGVFLEDDLELSPWFYVWLKNARKAYGKDPGVGAFTLCKLRLRNRKPANSTERGIGSFKLPQGTHAFKYRFQGSWGFAPQPKHWAHFLKWMKEMRNNGTKPYVDGLLTTNWYKGQERRAKLDYAPTMWTQWWVKYADVFGVFTVTPALDDGTTLAANWLEPGLHFFRKSTRSDAPVFRGNLSQLKWPDKIIKLDWDGTEILE